MKTLVVLGTLALASCISVRDVADPTVLVQTPAGIELGVNTDYGLVFLGNTAQAGEIDVTAWFGDGPSTEASIIEPIGGGLYTAEVDIRLPLVPLSFRTPEDGEEVMVVGRYGAERWEELGIVAADPRQTGGLLLQVPERLANAPYQVGAGVFVGRPQDELKLLVGLVSGHLRVTGNDGQVDDYLTVMGPEDLWRLVAHRRERSNKPRWVYREDIL